MKSVLTILILLVFCHETAQLRTSTDPPQPTYSDPNYEKQLNNVQNKLSTQIDQLKSQISEVDGIVKDASKSTGVKITSLTEKLADERN